MHTYTPQAFFTQEAINGIVDTTFGKRFFDERITRSWVR